MLVLPFMRGLSHIPWPSFRGADQVALKGFEMEISFVVRESHSAEAGVEYEVVTLNTKLQRGEERVQKLKLSWTPIHPAEEGEIPAEGSDNEKEVPPER
jgi:Trypsin-co-occurring domain 2